MIQRAAKEFWAAVAVGVVVLLAGHFVPHVALEVRQAEYVWLDWRFHVRGPEKPDPRIVIVAIDDASLRSEGQWPWPRRKLAELLRAIDEAKPLAVGLDILQGGLGMMRCWRMLCGRAGRCTCRAS
jgi:adenylate cyclase